MYQGIYYKKPMKQENNSMHPHKMSDIQSNTHEPINT